jgi:hypothetical protein
MTSVAFADFGRVDFFNCDAATQPLGEGTPRKTTMVDLSNVTHYISANSDNQPITSVITSGRNMPVVYTG